MGRGQQNQTISAADRERAAAEAFNQSLESQLAGTREALVPQYQNIINNSGLSESDKAAITGRSLGSLSSAFDALQQSAQNRLARTRNSAGFGELSDELAREKGRESASATQANELGFSNTAFNRQLAALQGLSGLYGVDTGLLSHALGIPPELLNIRASASRPGNGFFTALGQGLGSSLGSIPSAFF